MKRIAHLRKPSSSLLLLNPTLLLSTTGTIRHNHNSSSSSTTPPHDNQQLTQDELEKINLLLPRLCESNHLHEAIRLIDTVLLTSNPPLTSLSLPILIDRLTQESNMTESMSLLNRLKHNPSSHPSLLDINKLLITSYLKKQKLKEAIKVLSWISRPDSPCVADEMLYRILVKGLCRNKLTVEALRVIKKMVEENVVVAWDVRDWVYRSLLREARIREAQELNEALMSCGLVGGGDGDGNGKDLLHKVLGLLDHMITNWSE